LASTAPETRSDFYNRRETRSPIGETSRKVCSKCVDETASGFTPIASTLEWPSPAGRVGSLAARIAAMARRCRLLLLLAATAAALFAGLPPRTLLDQSKRLGHTPHLTVHAAQERRPRTTPTSEGGGLLKPTRQTATCKVSRGRQARICGLLWPQVVQPRTSLAERKHLLEGGAGMNYKGWAGRISCQCDGKIKTWTWAWPEITCTANGASGSIFQLMYAATYKTD
jgi:hypothetical protein